MKNIKLLLLAFVAVFSFNSCEDLVEAPGTNFVTFESESASIGVEQGGQTTKDIKIYSANVTSSDRTIGIIVDAANTDADPAAYTVPTTVTIPGGSNVGTLTVGLSDVGLSTDKTLVLGLEAAEGRSVGANITVGLSQVCPNMGVKVKLSLTFDSWPEEVSWTITDSNNMVVMEGSPNHTPYAGAYAGMSGTITITECLASGSYTLNVWDDYADGGTAFSLTGNGNPVTSLAGNAYGGSATVPFSL